MNRKAALDAVTGALMALDEVREATDAGVDPVSVLEHGIAPALRELGEKFQRGEVFIPHLAAAADMARRRMDELKDMFPAADADSTGPTVIL